MLVLDEHIEAGHAAFWKFYIRHMYKIYRLIYNMNKTVCIKVKTPVGVSESKEIHEIVAQGSADSGPTSANNISKGVERVFEDSEGEVEYLGIKLAPLILMDDIGRLADNVVSA